MLSFAILIALILGPVSGLVLTQAFSWRLVFILSVVVSIVVLLLAVVNEIVVLASRRS
ncbi:hypothetical protein [Fodinicola feengrottensis]|uniref:hypothetical protein n=1 Tax=Fodinicola feengrottensis TaxID=435914 RepID=UPI0013D2EF56|nr:hypothetical protein [Fodinicola feengrottensis]